jgi:hypothetical protein
LGNLRVIADTRLLLRGEAPPRSTDLAWELPLDFDPYALPDPSELQSTASSTIPNHTANHYLSTQDDVDPLYTELAEDGILSSTSLTNASTPQMQSRPIPSRQVSSSSYMNRSRRPTVIGPGGGDALDLSAFVSQEDEGLSLEEIGKRRHLEWVERSRKEGLKM